VPDEPAPQAQWLPQPLLDLVSYYTYGDGGGSRGAAPPCDPQAPLGGVVGQTGVFPRLEPLP
jgi:hypothetical protein